MRAATGAHFLAIPQQGAEAAIRVSPARQAANGLTNERDRQRDVLPGKP